ncbi:protein phosphatase [Arthrobacter sp. H5]|uniref:protein-tyrosine phosphatase family protein n=1 Tax=Arthrobacter sp. H5 TaxID=1267973 RepID=UPI000486C79E|nr:protein phosphatase [Arthrobacter sp. H5]
MEPWDQTRPDVLRLPSGRLIRGRGLRDGDVEGAAPQFGLYLLGKPPPRMEWALRWVRWPDWRLPVDRVDARDAFSELWLRAGSERVEVACDGGRGRTGTALACLAILDGIHPDDAVQYVRKHYNVKAVETPWQRRYVRKFQQPPAD